MTALQRISRGLGNLTESQAAAEVGESMLADLLRRRLVAVEASPARRVYVSSHGSGLLQDWPNRTQFHW